MARSGYYQDSSKITAKHLRVADDPVEIRNRHLAIQVLLHNKLFRTAIILLCCKLRFLYLLM